MQTKITWILFIGFILFSDHALAAKDGVKENVIPRVKFIVVSPGSVNDDGSGSELFIQVTLVEPALANDILKLTIVPARENAGDAQWKDLKLIQSVPINIKDNLVEVKVVIRGIKNGTIGIKAATSSKEQNDSSIYWMPVTINGK